MHMHLPTHPHPKPRTRAQDQPQAGRSKEGTRDLGLEGRTKAGQDQGPGHQQRRKNQREQENPSGSACSSYLRP